MNCHNCTTIRNQLKEESKKVANLKKELIKCQDYIRKRTQNSDPQTRILTSFKELQARFDRVVEEKEQLAGRMQESLRTVEALQSVVRELEHEKLVAQSGICAPSSSKNRAQDDKSMDKLQTVGMKLNGEDQLENIPDKSVDDLLSIRRVLSEAAPTREASELLTSFATFDSECEEFTKLHRAVTEFRAKYYQYMSTLTKNIAELENQTDLQEKKHLIKFSFPDPFSLELMSELESVLKRVVSSDLASAPRAFVSKCPICKQLMEEGQHTGFCDGCFQMYHLECGRAFALKGLACAAPNCTKKLEGPIWD